MKRSNKFKSHSILQFLIHIQYFFLSFLFRSRTHALKKTINAGLNDNQCDLEFLKSNSSDFELSNSSTASSDAVSVAKN